MIQSTASPGRILVVSGLLAAAAAATVACAGGPPGRPGAGGPPGPAPQRTAMFISPFGEPFLATPGEPWPVSDWFIGADRDLDQSVTFEEFAADGRRWFGDLDRDRSGRLEPAELAAYEERLRTLAGGHGGERAPRRRAPGDDGEGFASLSLAGAAPQDRPPGGAGRGRGRGAGARGGGYGPVAEAGFFNLPQPVKAADVNVDQRVTAGEWATATERWFLALDQDRDGHLTLASLPRTPLQARVEAGRR